MTLRREPLSGQMLRVKLRWKAPCRTYPTFGRPVGTPGGFADVRPRQGRHDSRSARPDEPGKWEQSDGKVRLYLVFGVNVHMTLDQTPFYKVEGIVALESKQAIDPARFDSASAPSDWALVNVVFTTVTTTKGPS